MVAQVRTVALQGVEVLNVTAQVQIANGLPAFHLVGLPDKAVAESRERVRAALYALGLVLPPKRIVVNLAPADVQKEGSHYDLPIAVSILAALEVIPKEDISNFIVLGELGLDGRIAKVTGVLPAAMRAVAGDMGLICPSACGAEARWAGEFPLLAPPNLLSLIAHFKGDAVLPNITLNLDSAAASSPHLQSLDISEVRGQESAKRALEIAAAGGHNLLMSGPPGAGKSMLASRLPSILPPLSPREALDVSMIHSIAGQLPEDGLVRTRPYRDPHHSASLPALIGGGIRAKPGEVSLAHNGVLFLDELPEFQRPTLEALRQPLESGTALISRANHHVRYPARFQLIAAMNPCRCGFMGDAKRACGRAPICGREYQSKLSGPLLDRIDLQIDMPAVAASDLLLPPAHETSAIVGKRVLAARNMQRQRNEAFGLASDMLNAAAGNTALDQIAPLSPELRQMLAKAAEAWGLSARGLHRVIKVARTIADLAESDSISPTHLAEALHFRGDLGFRNAA